MFCLALCEQNVKVEPAQLGEPSAVAVTDAICDLFIGGHRFDPSIRHLPPLSYSPVPLRHAATAVGFMCVVRTARLWYEPQYKDFKEVAS